MNPPWRKKHVMVFFAAIIHLTAMMPTPPAFSALLEGPLGNNITVDKTARTISVNLLNADIFDVAQTLSKQADVKVILEQSLSQTITGTFENMPLELGIKHLLGPTSSSFIFIEEKDKAGGVSYRLETVKIFPSGKMFSQNNVEFASGEPTTPLANSPALQDKGASPFREKESSTPAAITTSGANPQKTIGAMRHEIIQARSQLDVLRRKSQAEVNHIEMKIADIKRQLSLNPSPEKRAELTKELSRADMELVRSKNIHARIIIEEEKNIQEMAEQVLTASSWSDLPENAQKSPESRRQAKQPAASDPTGEGR